LDPRHIASVFALTPAEARLAAAVADGRSLESIAESSGVSLTTARNQLKSVLSKTDTHRQSELVALLARLEARRRHFLPRAGEGFIEPQPALARALLRGAGCGGSGWGAASGRAGA
jgi:DNA-binding CsgD family transcriptional regulator